MYIMNRWSNIIFESNDMNLGWDGKINGGKDEAPNDNYLYVISVQDAGGRQITKRGFVTLLR
jgi:gliding motility-associated-like protein